MKGTYPISKHGWFYVIDTIGVPHPYCITPKHVVYAADHCSGMLTKEAIERAEEVAQAKCDTCKGKLSYREHETALLVRCGRDPKKDKEAEAELHEWLLSIKEEAAKNGYAGFAFLKPEINN